MYSSLIDDPKNELLRARLSRLVDELRRLQLATREEYQAEVYSRINGILARGNQMRPLAPIPAAGPAKVGDLVENFSRLNQDGADVVSEILKVEETRVRCCTQEQNLARGRGEDRSTLGCRNPPRAGAGTSAPGRRFRVLR